MGCVHGCLYCYNYLFHWRRFGWRYRDWIRARPRCRTQSEVVKLVRRGFENFSPEERYRLYVSLCFDPYQPLEERYRYTRVVLETVLRETRWTIVLLTKAPRRALELDQDLYTRYRDRIWFGITLTHYRDDLCREVEPSAEPPTVRVEALKRAKELGLRTWVIVEPWIPYHLPTLVRGTVRRYLTTPVELLEKLPVRPDLLVLGKLNHVEDILKLLGIHSETKVRKLVEELTRHYRTYLPWTLKRLRELNYVLGENLFLTEELAELANVRVTYHNLFRN